MSIKIKSKNKLKVVLENTADKKTKTIFLGRGIKDIPTTSVLDACESFEELDFVTSLQKSQASTIEDMVATVNASGLDVARIKKLVEAVKIPGFEGKEDKERLVVAIVSSHNAEMGTKIVERANASEAGQALSNTISSSVHPDKGRAYEASEIAAKELEFSAAVDTFLKDFKENYLSAYFQDLKTMKPEEATKYMEQKLSVLSDALVSNFQKQYLNHIVGKDYEKQVALASEREVRSNIITEKVIVMLGEVLKERMEQIKANTTEMDEATSKNLAAASDFLRKAEDAYARVTERENQNRAALEGRRRALSDAAGREAPGAMGVTGEHDTSKARKQIIDDLFTASSELEELMYVFHSLVSAHSEFGTEGQPSVDESALEADGPYKAAKEGFEAHKADYADFKAYMEKIIGKKGDADMMSDEEVSKLTEDIKKVIAELKSKNASILEAEAYAAEIAAAKAAWAKESAKIATASELI